MIITSDGQYLLVAYTGNDEIKILQPGSLKILGQFGTGYLKSPRSIKIDEYGKIWVIDDENKRVTSFSFKGVFKNDTVNVKVIEKRNNVKMMQTSTKSASDASGQSYVVNSPKNQIKIFKKSGAQIGIYRAEGMKTPMAVETIGRYF